jgi:hypothetical protein
MTLYLATYCEFFGEKGEEHQFISPKNLFPITEQGLANKNKSAAFTNCMNRALDEMLTKESIIEVWMSSMLFYGSYTRIFINFYSFAVHRHCSL